MIIDPRSRKGKTKDFSPPRPYCLFYHVCSTCLPTSGDGSGVHPGYPTPPLNSASLTTRPDPLCSAYLGPRRKEEQSGACSPPQGVVILYTGCLTSPRSGMRLPQFNGIVFISRSVLYNTQGRCPRLSVIAADRCLALQAYHAVPVSLLLHKAPALYSE